MELRTCFNCIDDILHSGFKKEELFTSSGEMEPEVNWRLTATMNWPHLNERDAYYAMHYRVNGVDVLDYFKNCKELHFWYQLQEMQHKNKGTVTEIITLYMWDEVNGPVEVEDIMPHFGYIHIADTKRTYNKHH